MGFTGNVHLLVQYDLLRLESDRLMSTIVTLVGTKQAKVGLTFLHCGAVNECKGCKLAEVCQKLEPGRVYEVVGSRDIVHKCPIHEGGVTLVEVREASVLSTLDIRSCVPGALITYLPPKCERVDCSEFRKCNPLGLGKGDKCRIEEVIEKMGQKCFSGRQLGIVRLRRAATTST